MRAAGGLLMSRLPAAVVLSALILLMCAFPAGAQEDSSQKKQGPPPAKVIVTKAVSGSVTPRSVYVGTVYFPEVADVAAEVSGRVVRVSFEEGDRISRGTSLVALDTSLTKERLAASKAALAESRASLERERIEFGRLSRLYTSRTISEQDFDDSRYSVIELERRVDALQAEVAEMTIELAKARVPAPFTGVVLAREVERGEWLSPGATVAVLARDDAVDVHVNVPASVLRTVQKGASVPVRVGGEEYEGVVFAVIPRGDITTRTFPVKVRIKDAPGLAQGMDAEVRLPIGAPVQSLIVPRDAVVTSPQGTVIFTIADGAAQPVPIRVSDYMGLDAAISGDGLSPGMDVVVKGNERLRPGQSVIVSDRI